jgi:hypothetical protein
MLEKEYYFLKVKSNKLAVMIGINGAWLVRYSQGEGLATHEPVNSWVKPEGNTVNISYYQPPACLLEKGKAELEVILYQADPESKDVVKIKKVFYSHKFIAEDHSPIPPRTFVERAFELHSNVAAKVWTDAKVLDQNFVEDNLTEIYNEIKKLENLITAKEFYKAYSLQEYKFQEEALANYRTVENMKSSVLRDYGEMMPNELTPWQPLSKEKLSLRIIAERRILEANKFVYEYPIQLAIDKDKYQLEVPVYLARINDAWKIVR